MPPSFTGRLRHESVAGQQRVTHPCGRSERTAINELEDRLKESMRSRHSLDVGRQTEALELLYQERYSAFRNAIAPIVGNREVAHDVVQEAFAQALRDNHRLRSSDSLAPWIWRIASRLALRERGRLRSGENLDDLALVAHDAERYPEIDAAVRSLPPKRRMVIFLRYFADFSYAEIADALGVSEGTVAATLAQGRAALKNQLAKEVAP